jgi:hypothetical protein
MSDGAPEHADILTICIIYKPIFIRTNVETDKIINTHIPLTLLA